MSVFDTMYKWIKTGASDAAAAAGEIFPIAGLYQATPTEVDDGDVGRVRMSARRASIVAKDYITDEILHMDIDAATKTVGDIVFYDFHTGLLGSTDGTTPGTASTIAIPFSDANYRDFSLQIRTGGLFYDQNTTLALFAANSINNSANSRNGKLLSFVLPASSAIRISIGSATAGQGAIVGGASAVQNAFYDVSVPAGTPFIHITLSAGVAPSTGTRLFQQVYGRGS